MNRRQFLQGFGAVAIGAEPFRDKVIKISRGVFAPSRRDSVAHMIERLTFGITPMLYSRLGHTDIGAFVTEQIDSDAIEESFTLQYSMQAFNEILSENGGVLIDRDVEQHRLIPTALYGSVVLRAMYSERQLFERMVQFFSNHFHISISKGFGLYLKIDDDRDVIRPYALTTFRELLGASAHSPAMLQYLDNYSNTLNTPNENYAREIMELHTLGLESGFTEDDVKEVSRCLTGWSTDRMGDTEDGSIHYHFRDTLHDEGTKLALGLTIPSSGGQQDGERILDLLAQHPSTARFISTKIARRFVSDYPPEALVERLARSFEFSRGDIRGILHTLIISEEFWNAPPKFKQPLEYVISILRALSFEVDDSQLFIDALSVTLRRLGQLPYDWPSPSGFPDIQDVWEGTLLERWNFALAAVTDKIPGAHMNFESLLDLMETEGISMNPDEMLMFMGRYIFGRPLIDEEQDVILNFARSEADTLQKQVAVGIALLLASPAFQYR